jgi:hypothetical protein
VTDIYRQLKLEKGKGLETVHWGVHLHRCGGLVSGRRCGVGRQWLGAGCVVQSSHYSVVYSALQWSVV